MHRLFEHSAGEAQFKHIQGKKLHALFGYCESVVCRRKLLLNYFDETYEAPCGNCDSCLNPADTWDGTVAAQKALSCVYRTGQRFGAGHLANVLMGKPTEQVLRWKHDRIKTYGVGSDLDHNTWRSVFRQLLSSGLLAVDMEKIAGFRLTPDSWAVLKGQQEVFFREDTVDSRQKAISGPKKRAQTAVLEDDADQQLFENLRKLRRGIARRLEVPPFVIFHDKTLIEMAAVKPQTVDGLLQITGVGETKAGRYGDLFLACIRGEAVDVGNHFEAN
jgi:ATP-dependent DNA helicase RecQ